MLFTKGKYDNLEYIKIKHLFVKWHQQNQKACPWREITAVLYPAKNSYKSVRRRLAPNKEIGKYSRRNFAKKEIQMAIKQIKRCFSHQIKVE